MRQGYGGCGRCLPQLVPLLFEHLSFIYVLLNIVWHDFEEGVGL